MPRACISVVLAVIFATATLSFETQQGKTKRITQYIYDDNGRLQAVIAPPCGRAIYEYDPAGNITAIKRVDSSPVLDSFFPKEAAAGDVVTFLGAGFGEKAEDNTVSFNGVRARVLRASITEIAAVVPENIALGVAPIAITITTPCGTVKVNFTLIAGLKVIPPTATVETGQSVQFTAVVTGLSDKKVKWSVNGINGGNASIGTISDTGLYTAPSSVPSPPAVTVRATSIARPSLFGEAKVTIESGDIGA